MGRLWSDLPLLVALALLAACASAPRSAPAPKPHYKLGAPYQINGKRYEPRADPTYEKVGVASWYGKAFEGKPTANGEIFERRWLSAAPTTLPLPSLVEVENLENGRRLCVRVNDRGPFLDDRLIDLSEAAAEALGFYSQGLARVRVRYLGQASLAERAPLWRDDEARVAEAPRRIGRPPDAGPGPPQSPPPAIGPATAPTADAYESVETASDRAPFAEFWIAVASFPDIAAVETARVAIGGSEEARVVATPGDNGLTTYALQIGPFVSVAEAEARLAQLREAGYPDAAIMSGDF